MAELRAMASSTSAASSKRAAVTEAPSVPWRDTDRTIALAAASSGRSAITQFWRPLSVQ